MKPDEAPEATRLAYTYSDLTGEYLFPVKVHLSHSDGAYALPDHTVDFPPDVVPGPHCCNVISARRDAWEVKADYRNIMLYDKATSMATPNRLALGDSLPDYITILPPPHLTEADYLRSVWDDTCDAWGVEPDYSHALVWDTQTGFPADRLAPGQPLTEMFTLIAPPAGAQQPIWDPLKQQWIVATDEIAPEDALGDYIKEQDERLK